MSDAHRPSSAPSSQALVRYSVLAQVEALILGGWPVSAAGREVAGRDHADLDGHPVRVSQRTIQRWRRAYADGGMAALEPKDRTRTTTSLALSEALVAFLRAEKETDPRASIPELLRRARVRGIVPEDLPVDRTTLWRACRRLGLATRARPSKREGDMRRWRYVHRMQCVLCDLCRSRHKSHYADRRIMPITHRETVHGIGIIRERLPSSFVHLPQRRS